MGVFSTVFKLLFDIINSMIFFGVMKAFKSKDQHLTAQLVLDGLYTCCFIWNEPWLIDSSLWAIAVVAWKQPTVYCLLLSLF